MYFWKISMKVSSEKWAGSASGELKISPFVLKDDIMTHRMGNTERIMTTASTRDVYKRQVLCPKRRKS